MSEDTEWFARSTQAIEDAANRHHLVSNAIIYGEVSVRYSRIEDLKEALTQTREATPYEAAFLAGKCFLKYRQRAGTRRSPLPDFLTGAHAAVADYPLMTRAAARYRAYFLGLHLLTPQT